MTFLVYYLVQFISVMHESISNLETEFQIFLCNWKWLFAASAEWPGRHMILRLVGVFSLEGRVLWLLLSVEQLFLCSQVNLPTWFSSLSCEIHLQDMETVWCVQSAFLKAFNPYHCLRLFWLWEKAVPFHLFTDTHSTCCNAHLICVMFLTSQMIRKGPFILLCRKKLTSNGAVLGLWQLEHCCYSPACVLSKGYVCV